jgi:hypothetical protein
LNGGGGMDFLTQLDKPEHLDTKDLKEKLENAYEELDNISRISFLSFSICTGGSPSG